MPEWDSNYKIATSVIGSSIIGAVASPGAVFMAERVTPRQMNWLKRVVAEHVITPHQELFEKMFARHLRASDLRRETTGEIAPPDPALLGESPDSAKGRALTIADGMVSTMMAFAVDFGVTLAAQKHINKKLGVNTAPLRTTFVDSAASLGVMAIMPTLLAKPSEALNHTLSEILQKVTGMPKHNAEDFTLPAVYSGLPNLIGTAAALYSAHAFNKGRG
jgi:hypothetical protein